MQNSVIVYHNPNHATPEQDIKKVVIWLHGLGASGDDFVPVVPELKLKQSVKFIFPHAPKLAVTVNGGYVMPAWYDIYEMGDIERKVDSEQIHASSSRIIDIIHAHNKQGIPMANIVVAGFSQGGAIAYHSALSLAKRGEQLGGLLALSTYFPTVHEFSAHQFAAQDLPILINHGSYDDVVSPYLGQQAASHLAALGFHPVSKTYPMAHQVCMAQIGDIGQWLDERFANQKSD